MSELLDMPSGLKWPILVILGIVAVIGSYEGFKSKTESEIRQIVKQELIGCKCQIEPEIISTICEGLVKDVRELQEWKKNSGRIEFKE